MTPGALFVVALLSGCTSGPDPTSAADPLTLQTVWLPELSGMEPAVQEQMRAAHALVMAMQQSASRQSAELGAAFGQMGMLLMAAEYYDAAEPCFRNAESLVPGEVRWPYHLGHLYRARHEPAKAAASFERSLRVRPDNEPALVWLARAYLELDEPDAAETPLLRALSRRPGSAPALFGLGRAALARQDYPRAAQYLESALAADPHATAIQYPLAMAYRGVHELDKANAHAQQRGAVEPALSDPLIDEARGLLQSRLAWETRGDQALERGQFHLALSAYRRGVELALDNAALRHKLGTALAVTGDRRGALEQFDQALRLAPGFAKAHYSIGVLLAASGQTAEAAEHFSAAVKSDPGFLEARRNLETTRRQAGNVPRNQDRVNPP